MLVVNGRGSTSSRLGVRVIVAILYCTVPGSASSRQRRRPGRFANPPSLPPGHPTGYQLAESAPEVHAEPSADGERLLVTIRDLLEQSGIDRSLLEGMGEDSAQPIRERE